MLMFLHTWWIHVGIVVKLCASCQEIYHDYRPRPPRRSRRNPLVPLPHAHVGIVLVGTAVERANNGEFVHHSGKARHVFADLDAGDIGGNRTEGAADLGRRVHLEIVHILM